MSGANGAGDDRLPNATTGPTHNNAAAASLNHLTSSEIKALQKQWRLEKRRELEARNRKKQARLQHVDGSVAAPHVLAQAQAQVHAHAATAAGPAVSGSTALPVSAAAPVQVTAPLPVSTANSLHSSHLGPPVKRFKAAYLADNPYPPHPTQINSTPTSAAATYQHYEYVGMGTLPQCSTNIALHASPTGTAPGGIATQPDDSARTLEAQRAWREQKMREVAEKRNKAAPSKRGRRKTVVALRPGGGADDVTSSLSLGADALHGHEPAPDETTIAPIVTSLPMQLPVGATDPLAQQELPPASSADLVNLAGPLSAYGFINTPGTSKDEQVHVDDEVQHQHQDHVQVEVHEHAQDQVQVHDQHQDHEHKSQVVHSETGNEKLEPNVDQHNSTTYQTDFNIETGDELVGNVQHAWTDLGN